LFFRAVVWILIALVALATSAAALAAWHVFVKEREAKRERDIEAAALADLEARKAALTEKLDTLDTARGVEEEIRNRFPLVKPGETVITIVNPTPISAAERSEQSKNFWQRIVSWFSW
jgi:cell division protein FtsB